MSFVLANVGGRSALVKDGDYFDLETISGGSLSNDPMDVFRNIDLLHDLNDGLADHAATGSLDGAALEAPVPKPGNSYAVGLNYRNHAEEAGLPIPAAPMVFTKFPSCIAGPHTDVRMRSDYVDFEGELVAVIGKTASQVPLEQALDYVAGLCVGQDISDRPTQFTSQPAQFNLGKSFDTFGPIGPCLVSLDQITDDNDLMLTTEVNGEVRQQDSARDLIFDVPALVAYLSDILTLHPGDLIFTGTPGGVGVVEGRFLKDGDMVKTTIKGLGTIENKCIRVSDHARAKELPENMKALANRNKK